MMLVQGIGNSRKMEDNGKVLSHFPIYSTTISSCVFLNTDFVHNYIFCIV